MYVAPAFGGLGLITVPSASERLLSHGAHGVRVDRRPGKPAR